MPTVNDVLYCAQQWIGYSRWTDPEEGTVFGRWYAEKTGDSYYGTSGVPYCAMFASYCLDWAGVSAPECLARMFLGFLMLDMKMEQWCTTKMHNLVIL